LAIRFDKNLLYFFLNDQVCMVLIVSNSIYPKPPRKKILKSRSQIGHVIGF